MRALAGALGCDLAWQARSLLSRTYDLVDHAAPETGSFAMLTVRRMSFVPHAEIESAGGRWSLRRAGFWRPRVLVLAGDAPAPLATFTRTLGSGLLRFEDGRAYRWRRPSFWSLGRRFEDADGMPVVSLHYRFGFPRGRGGVELGTGAERLPEAALLAGLGWYLVLLARRRSAAA